MIKKLLLLLALILVLPLMACTADEPGYMKVVDDSKNVITIDELSRTVTIIDFQRHKLHKGNTFVTEVVDTSMNLNDALVVAFQTPDTAKWSHMAVSGWSLTSAHMNFIEGSTWDTNTGSQVPIFNRNRNSSSNSTLLEDTTGSFLGNNAVLLNPTNLAGGTEIHNIYIGANQRAGEEFVLKQNTTYSFELIADEASSVGHLILNWYEHISLE